MRTLEELVHGLPTASRWSSVEVPPARGHHLRQWFRPALRAQAMRSWWLRGLATSVICILIMQSFRGIFSARSTYQMVSAQLQLIGEFWQNKAKKRVGCQ
jgi:hypothetical protein